VRKVSADSDGDVLREDVHVLTQAIREPTCLKQGLI
jgi:hypothetical protein